MSLAAERIFLSQSATSSALGRLRDYFADDLLVVRGRQMVLTARAESLVEPVRAVLEQIRSTIAVAPPFDPATSDRMIRIMASDYSTEVLVSTALRDLSVQAPGMQFEITPMADGPIESLERGGIDLLLTIDFAISADHPSQFLFQDDYVVVGWSGNPHMAGEMTEALYFSLGHVTHRFGKSRMSAFEDWFVRRQTKPRRIEVVAPSFLSAPALVVGTNRIATMHRRLAVRVAEHLPLVIKPAPMAIPPIREAVQWHLSNNNDAAIRWVVEGLMRAAAEQLPIDVPATVVSIETGRAKALSHAEIAVQFKASNAPAARP